ncbi:SRPBCC family protein [Nocardia sp. BMG51109]|uniref:SRPBCC family protein n=1 Tax=Nocardia sp. BMG51109 TaxID=1056816 RepID=UPI000463DF49|nr:SRPBCC family protein [Nocardia sp. BMG51109]
MPSDVVSVSRIVPAPVHVVFDYVFDYEKIPEWVAGVSGYQRHEDLPEGFTLEMSIGAVKHQVTLATESWIRDTSIGLVETSGHDARVDVDFEPVRADSCRVAVRISYPVREGLLARSANVAGRIIARRIIDSSAGRLERRIATGSN